MNTKSILIKSNNLEYWTTSRYLESLPPWPTPEELEYIRQRHRLQKSLIIPVNI